MNAEVARIGQALGALLTAMIEDEERWPEPALYHIRATPYDPSKPVKTRAEMEVGQLLQEPVYFACRLAVRRLGERVHAVADGMAGCGGSRTVSPMLTRTRAPACSPCSTARGTGSGLMLIGGGHDALLTRGLGRMIIRPDLRDFWSKIWPGLIVGLCAGVSISLARHFGWIE